MALAYSKANLAKLEDLLLEAGFMLRVAKGNFRSGYCIVKDSKIVLVNGFLKGESRFNVLFELIGTLSLDEERLAPGNREVLKKVKAV